MPRRAELAGARSRDAAVAGVGSRVASA